jgi:hypothetical protein
MKNDDDEPPAWLTAIKLVLGAAAIIGGVGFVLWYLNEEQLKDVSPAVKPVDSWGIVTDSPIRYRR